MSDRTVERIIEWLAWALGPIVRALEWIGRGGRRLPAWKCAEHGPRGLVCFCDEERDREAGIHRASGLSDAFGGYLCVCLRGSFTRYGCLASTDDEAGP